MREPARLAPVRILLAFLIPILAPAGALAQVPAEVPAATGTAAADVPRPADSAAGRVAAAERAVAESRELLKAGDYDRSIEVLKAGMAVESLPAPLERDLYLQLIKTYVTLGNDLKYRPQGREASNLNYVAARALVVECLSKPALRRTRPEPATEYPPEMLRLFAEVRAERFGAFRVAGLRPATASVRFDGDTLAATPEGTMAREDVPVGTHSVVVGARGHRTISETVTISPGGTLERTYELRRGRGPMWYGTWGTLAAGIAAGIVALTRDDAGSPADAGPTLLPPAPPPPTR